MVGQLTLVGRITYFQESSMTHALSKVRSEYTTQLQLVGHSSMMVCSSTNVIHVKSCVVYFVYNL